MKTRNKHATLGEVAKAAGVGTTTVSRVINGGQSVDPKTLARVQRAIERLGYMPSQAARILKGDRTRAIGLVVPSIADPFFSSCAEAAQEIVRSNDSVLIVLTSRDSPAEELSAVNTLMRHRVDGLMIAPCNAEDDVLARMLSRIATVVTLDRPIAGSKVPSVLVDNSDGAKLAAQHLIEHGYRRIACFAGNPSLYTMRERTRGYTEAMQSSRLKPSVYNGVEDRDSARELLISLLRDIEPPEAILTLKNSTTLAVFETLQSLGVKIPNTIALLGYDDFQMAEALRPSITVIRQPVEGIGQAAAKLLFDRMPHQGSPGGAGSKCGDVILKTQLVTRESCGCNRG